MNNKHCDYVHENLALYIGGELHAGDAEAIVAHLAVCTQCAARHTEMQEFLAVIKSDTVALPDEQAWRRMADEAFIKWQSGTMGEPADVKPPVFNLSRWIAALPSLFVPVIKPALATAFILFAGAAIFLANRSDDSGYNRGEFYADYFPESTVLQETGDVQDYSVMGFDYQGQPGSFALGVEYARTHQACAFAFEQKCKDSVQKLNRILNEYPHNIGDRAGIRFSRNKTAQLASLQTLQTSIKRGINVLEAEYFLYQFGNWAQDMNLAAALRVNGIVEERQRAGDFIRQAKEFNLAKGVIAALTHMENVLSKQELTVQDFETLRAHLIDIYTILI